MASPNDKNNLPVIDLGLSPVIDLGLSPVKPEEEEKKESRGILGTTYDVAAGTASVLGDVGQGIGAGGVNIIQGIGELGGIGVDYGLGKLGFETNIAGGIASVGQGTKNFLGLTPEGTTGKVAEGIVTFGSVLIPVAGWVGAASNTARGVQTLRATSTLGRSAQAFGRTRLGKKTLGADGLLGGVQKAAFTSVGAGVADVIVAPEGFGTMADSFDALPDFLQTEDDTGLSGQDEAARKFRNKLRIGFEGGLLGAAGEIAFPLISGGARATGRGIGTAVDFTKQAAGKIKKIPGIPQAGSAIVNGFEVLGQQVPRIPGGQRLIDVKDKTKSLAQNFLLSRGTAPEKLYEGGIEADAVVDAITKSATNRFQIFEKALKKAIGGQRLLGRGRAGVRQGHERLVRYLEGDDTALDMYGESVVRAGSDMRSQIDALTEELTKQVERSTALRPQDKLRLIEEMNAGRGKYLRRVYAQNSDPNFLVPQNLAENRNFQSAVAEVADMLIRTTPEGMAPEVAREQAELMIRTSLGKGALDYGIPVEKLAAQQAKSMTVGAKQLGLGKHGDRPLHAVVEGLFKRKKNILEDSIAYRKLLGEYTDPKTRYLTTIGDMAKTYASNRFYDDAAKTFGVDFNTARNIISQGGRPLAIKMPGNMTGDQVSEFADSIGYKYLAPETIQEISEETGEVLVKESATTFGGRFGSMTGYVVSPEIYHSIAAANRNTMPVLSSLYSAALQVKGLGQISQTVLDALAQVRNFVSGNFMLLANGNLMRNLDFSEGAALTFGKVANLNKKEFKDFYDKIGLIGIRDQNIQLNEFQLLLKEASEAKYAGKSAQAIQQLMNKAPVLKQLQAIYGGTDTFYKVLGFMAERAKYSAAFKKAGVGFDSTFDPANPLAIALRTNLVNSGVARREVGTLPRQETDLLPGVDFFDIFTGDIVKRTMPTYSRVPKIIKSIRRIPIAGNFVAFPAEILRNSVNIVQQGMREMAFKVSDEVVEELASRIGVRNPQMTAEQVQASAIRSAKELQKQIRGIGGQRVSGYVSSAIILPSATKTAAMTALEYDEEDMAAMQKIAPSYLKGHDLIPLSRPNNKGEIEFIDFSYMNPYDFALAPAKAAMQIYAEKGELTDSEVSRVSAGMWEGFKTFIEPFGSESLMAERIIDVMPSGSEFTFGIGGRGGRTTTGSRIYTEEDAASGDAFTKSINHILGGLVPGLVEDLFVKERRGEFVPGRVYRAITGMPGPRGQNFDVYEESVAYLTGLRGQKLDIPESIKFAGLDFANSRGRISSVFNSVVKANDSTEADMIAAYQKANEDKFRSMSELYSQIQAFRRLLPEKQADRIIRQQLKREGRMGTKEISLLLRGKFLPISVNRQNIMKDINRDLNVKGERRLVDRPPFDAFREMELNFRGMDLGVIEETVRDTPIEETQPTSPDPNLPVINILPDSNLPVIDLGLSQAPAPAPSSQVAQATPDPALLGSNPIEVMKNLQIAQRT